MITPQDKIDAIRKWSKNYPDFDSTFIDSVEEWMWCYDITYHQEKALDNIIEKFHIKVVPY